MQTLMDIYHLTFPLRRYSERYRNINQSRINMESSNILIENETYSPIPQADRKPTPTRLATLDVFRGLTIAIMILVDDAGGEWPQITHAPWNGCNLADFVMPFFLFIVGTSISLTFKRVSAIRPAVNKVLMRTLKLVFWGILLQGGYSHAPDELSYGVDLKKIRWCGILQRIALAYLVVALVEILTKKLWPKEHFSRPFDIYQAYLSQWIAGFFILFVYIAAVYGIYVPDWHFVVHDSSSPNHGKSFVVNCGVRGKLDPPCNAVGYIDHVILGLNHMYHHPAWRRSKYCTENSPHEGPIRKDAPVWCWAPFEPEGLLSSVASILSTIIGLHYGHVIIHFEDHIQRLKHWLVIGVGLVIAGFTLHFTNVIPLNKQLYTPSYVCVTAGTGGILFSVLYLLIDIWGIKKPFKIFEWMGMNAMFIFVMAAEGIFAGFFNGWYYESPNNTLVYWIQKHVFINTVNSKRIGVLLYVIIGEILFWGIIAGILHHQGFHWKL